MDARELETKLGIPPGETLTALVALAERVAPKAPWSAFEPLRLLLPWLKPCSTIDDLRHLTPENVHPFAETGGDLNHFGFLMDGDVPTDERPIVSVIVKDDDEATTIVAPNLRAFLGLIAVADGEFVSRAGSDHAWRKARHVYRDTPARIVEMERLSTLLCTLPGVERPVSPSQVANAYPNQAFVRPEEESQFTDQEWRLRQNVQVARDRVKALAIGMVDGQVVHGERLAVAKQEATAALLAALDMLAAVDAKRAAEFVAGWDEVRGLMQRGLAGDFDVLLEPYTRKRTRRR